MWTVIDYVNKEKAPGGAPAIAGASTGGPYSFFYPASTTSHEEEESRQCWKEGHNSGLMIFRADLTTRHSKATLFKVDKGTPDLLAGFLNKRIVRAR